MVSLCFWRPPEASTPEDSVWDAWALEGRSQKRISLKGRSGVTWLPEAFGRWDFVAPENERHLHTARVRAPGQIGPEMEMTAGVPRTAGPWA